MLSIWRNTIIEFLTIHAALRPRLWTFPLTLYVDEWNNWGACISPQRVLSPYFKSGSDLRLASVFFHRPHPIFPFLLLYEIEDVLPNALSGLLDGGIELLPGFTVIHSEYADNMALLSDDAQTIHQALDHLGIGLSKYGICFVYKFQGTSSRPARACACSPSLSWSVRNSHQIWVPREPDCNC